MLGKELEIRIPQIKIKHIEAVEALANARTIDGQVYAVSKILDIDREKLYAISIGDLNEIVRLILKQAEPTSDKPAKKIEGYELVDFEQLPVGWYIDYDVLLEQHNGNLPHEYVMAFSYIEKGKEWHEADIKKRAEAMAEMPAIHYLNLMGFFLKWRTAIQRLKKWLPKEKPKTHITG